MVYFDPFKWKCFWTLYPLRQSASNELGEGQQSHCSMEIISEKFPQMLHISFRKASLRFLPNEQYLSIFTKSNQSMQHLNLCYIKTLWLCNNKRWMWIYIVCKLINLFIALLNKKRGVESQWLSTCTERQTTEQFVFHLCAGTMYMAIFHLRCKHVKYL